jgi:wyosine [tRNA(Phe)-imidazoG37] synthetase (radical SAM superfamily)
MTLDRDKLQTAWRRHERRWADNLYVYAVVSRRSGGVSVGINLNPGKECNFDCIYCQVDRTTAPAVQAGPQAGQPRRGAKVDLERLAAELDRVLAAERDGSLYDATAFAVLRSDERGVRDIAFSGDGEPTTYPRFGDVVRIAADARRRFNLETTKLVLITDSAYLTKPAVREALVVMDENNGEVWAKLDAGTEEYFRLVDRPNVSLKAILDSILATARVRPIVIQTLWFRVHGQAPPAQEIEAYCARLRELLDAGAQLKAIQLYSIARAPAEKYAGPLSDAELDGIAETVAARVPVPVEKYYGVRSEAEQD